jgi:hypothetical protein
MRENRIVFPELVAAVVSRSRHYHYHHLLLLLLFPHLLLQPLVATTRCPAAAVTITARRSTSGVTKGSDRSRQAQSLTQTVLQ